MEISIANDFGLMTIVFTNNSQVLSGSSWYYDFKENTTVSTFVSLKFLLRPGFGLKQWDKACVKKKTFDKIDNTLISVLCLWDYSYKIAHSWILGWVWLSVFTIGYAVLLVFSKLSPQWSNKFCHVQSVIFINNFIFLIYLKIKVFSIFIAKVVGC